MTISDNIKSAAFMTLAMAGFAFNDALMKLIFEDIGLYQSILIRGIIATTLLGLFMLKVDGWQSTKGSMNKLVLLRVLGEVGGTICFLTAIIHIAFADASAILQVLPLAVTLAAAVLLKERISWQRMAAIIIGLVGVLVIIKPVGAAINPYYFVALGAVFFLVLRDITTRMMQEEISSNFVAFLTSLGVTAVGVVGVLFEDWQPIGFYEFAVLFGSSLFLIVAYVFSVLAFRQGDVGYVAPFIYTYLVWAILLGVLMFREYPDLPTIIGSVIVVLAGIYSFWREEAESDRTTNEEHLQ
jgi:drug/metabolite transporter (DMT)-like permease